ncbi:MAG: ATP-binding cassette domain-containing protein [Bacteriovoracaceae bacterium]
MKNITRESIHSIKFKDLNFTYHGQKAIFEQVNFEFPMNQMIIFQGPTGGGKNTLLKLMAGLVAPSEGKLLINDIEVQNFSFPEFDRYRLSIGYTFDVGGLINNLTLYENFKLVLDFHSSDSEADKKRRILELLNVMNLDEIKHLRPSAVSSGAKKAAMILRAFILNPEMLILNNPTLGLNFEHIDSLISLIEEHKKTKNLKHIFVSSDDINFIQAFDYQSLKIVNGHITMGDKFQGLKDYKRAG